jgi:ribosomal protein S17
LRKTITQKSSVFAMQSRVMFFENVSSYIGGIVDIPCFQPLSKSTSFRAVDAVKAINRLIQRSADVGMGWATLFRQV